MNQLEIYVSEFSRYVIVLLMLLYTYESFAVFRYHEEERRKGIYTRQSLLLFAFHFSCFVTICFETGDINYLFFYAFQQIMLYAFDMSSLVSITNPMQSIMHILLLTRRFDFGYSIRYKTVKAYSIIC